jgi:hypothetical protein
MGILDRIPGGVVYLRVRTNHMRLRDAGTGREVEVPAAEPFTTKRLLVGEFTVAERLLADGLKRLGGGSWFRASPVLVIHPLEMVDGGLSQIEERVLRELGVGAGGRRVIIHVGSELSDPEVREYARGR